MRPITHIVIHCSASLNGDARVTFHEIERWHKARGFREIGYHYVIHIDGSLWAGRPLAEMGAHVEGSNARSIGVCMVGTDRFSAAQWETLRNIVAGLQEQFQAARVVGHRDFSPDQDGDGVIEPWEWMKTCPGFEVSLWHKAAMQPLADHLLEAA